MAFKEDSQRSYGYVKVIGLVYLILTTSSIPKRHIMMRVEYCGAWADDEEKTCVKLAPHFSKLIFLKIVPGCARLVPSCAVSRNPLTSTVFEKIKKKQISASPALLKYRREKNCAGLLQVCTDLCRKYFSRKPPPFSKKKKNVKNLSPALLSYDARFLLRRRGQFVLRCAVNKNSISLTVYE